jgi:membrane-bound lytic murein transglycosylase A
MFLRSRWPLLTCVAIAGGLLAHAETAHGQSAPPPSVVTTKHAHFIRSQFSDLPGWREDSLADAWSAFRQSCVAVANRSAWAEPCKRSLQVNARADADIRRFIESEFIVYEIRNADQSPTGMITGYYEPLLNGSRQYGPQFAHPVYGVPEDLLLLDARSIPQSPTGSVVLARIEGRNVVPVCATHAGSPCAAPFTLDIGDAKPDVKDKRIRVRREGHRIVPYYTRKEIEKGALAMGGVLAWVDNLGALYSMQVQGSGKVRMPDGQILRLAFAEQNGHPFTPPVKPRTRGLGMADEILTRGMAIPLEFEGDAVAPAAAEKTIASPRPLTRGLRPPGESDDANRPANSTTSTPAAAPTPDTPTAKKERSPEVERMIARLMQAKAARMSAEQSTAQAPAPTAATTSVSPAPKSASPATSPKAQAAVAPAPSTVPSSPGGHPVRPEPAMSSSIVAREIASKFTGLDRDTPFSTDPSYVFFRQIADADAGPIGALGVPLTAGRSIAVDPRTTPLGSPVFISTEGQSAGSRFNRLMFAQDTGGAIRGAVRADFFWGFGPNAFARASRMRENGRMWLMLPKDIRLGAQKPLTRGIGGLPGGNESDCLVPDPELCVE